MPGLWTPGDPMPESFVKKHYERERIVTLPNGRRARVWIDDSNTVKQIEEDDRQHAIVRPRTIALKVRVENAK